MPSLCHAKVGDGTPLTSHVSFSTWPIFFIKFSDAGELDFISVRKKKMKIFIENIRCFYDQTLMKRFLANYNTESSMELSLNKISIPVRWEYSAR